MLPCRFSRTLLVSAFCRLILAEFLKSDAAKKIVRQSVRRRGQQKQSNMCAGQPAPTSGNIILVSNDPQNKLHHV
jgi:hypothetical protein